MILHLLRHGKSSWAEPGVDDDARPLAPRGERSARRLAAELKGMGVKPKLALCSSALRARRTLELIRDALPATMEVLVEDRLYAADADDLLARLRQLPVGASEVLLVGHNPGLHELALALAGEAAPAELRENLPTGALVSLRLRGKSWGSTRAGEAAILRIWRPR